MFDTDDVEFRRIWFDGSGLAPMSSVNKYLIMAGNGSVRRKNHLYEDVRFIECNASDGLKVYRNLLVTHGIYVDNVDSVEIKRCGCSGLSGAFVFANDADRLQIHRPDVVDAHWYPIHLDHGVTNFEIGNGRVVMNNPEGVMWGGGIDSMSQMGGSQNANGHIHDMVLQGYFSYGSACRLESNASVTLQNITVENWQAGSWIPPDSQGDMSAFSVGTRGAQGKGHNRPSRDIVLSRLTASAPGNTAKHRGIYISNEWTEQHQSFEGVLIEDCRIVSSNAERSFAEAVTIHGQFGGVENVAIRNLEASTHCQYGSVGTGAVGMLATAAPGAVRGVHLSGLRLRDIGRASGAQIGVAIGAFTDDVRFEAENVIDGYYYGVRALADAGRNVAGWSTVRFDDVPPGGERFHRDDAGPLGR